MAKGKSLHIGLNEVDPGAYGGWDGKLYGCVNDASDLAEIAAAKAFETKKLIDSEATADDVSTAITRIASELKDGDIFLLTYSGHGGSIADANGDESDRDENDSRDETWILYDRQLVDDELHALLGKFAAGVRIFMLSDSCHSGTIAKAPPPDKLPDGRLKVLRKAAEREGRFRWAPRKATIANYVAYKEHFDGLRNARGENEAIPASCLLISGCQDLELSSDGDLNGLFTERLKEVWGKGDFKDDYTAFHAEILKRMPKDQRPNLFLTGTASAAFVAQTPFTI